jgi:2-polyprenyl-6-methoxyphenol hydroxylase-like FAD-dependent oxidoreductase
MTEHAVVIAGGGPTGLMLAAELVLAGTDVLLVERRTSQALEGSRAGGLLARTLEVLDQRGVAERFIAAGQTYPMHGFAGITMDVSDFPTRHNHTLGLWQQEIERILAEWVLDELGAPIRRGCEVIGLTQDDDGVDVALSDGTSLRAQFVVGCDGGRSVVRKEAGIAFEGWDASLSMIIAEVEMAEEPVLGMRRGGGGIGPVTPGQPGGPYRLTLPEASVEHTGDPTLDDVRAVLVAADGTDYGVHSPTWISRFTDMARQAVAYRADRVLLAGDAAHVHSPHGGQGLNTGVQDAVNLGWKLAQVVRGTSPDTLLDTYHAERHPVGARVLQNTMAQVALSNGDDRHQALRDTMIQLLAMDEPRRAIAGMLTALDIRYDLGGDHPLVGRRMPDLDIETKDGPTRVYELLHEAQPLLLNLGAPADVTGVRVVDATHEGTWELPVIGKVAPPRAVLIRPDGHVAWTGDLADPGLLLSVETWFGPPAAHATRP